MPKYEEKIRELIIKNKNNEILFVANAISGTHFVIYNSNEDRIDKRCMSICVEEESIITNENLRNKKGNKK